VVYLVEQSLAVLAVWGLWMFLATVIEAGERVWNAFALVAGLGAQALLDLEHIFLGLGIGGGAILLMRVADVLLVTADWIRVTVLRNRR
jgi:hypothetical protein